MSPRRPVSPHREPTSAASGCCGWGSGSSAAAWNHSSRPRLILPDGRAGECSASCSLQRSSLSCCSACQHPAAATCPDHLRLLAASPVGAALWSATCGGTSTGPLEATADPRPASAHLGLMVLLQGGGNGCLHVHVHLCLCRQRLEPAVTLSAAAASSAGGRAQLVPPIELGQVAAGVLSGVDGSLRQVSSHRALARHRKACQADGRQDETGQDSAQQQPPELPGQPLLAHGCALLPGLLGPGDSLLDPAPDARGAAGLRRLGVSWSACPTPGTAPRRSRQLERLTGEGACWQGLAATPPAGA